eukprot:875114_1
MAEQWNVDNDVSKDDQQILRELKAVTLKHNQIMYTIFRYLCGTSGDAKWLNVSSFRYFVDNCNVIPKQNEQVYAKTMANILSNIWYVINVRNQAVYKQDVSPRRRSVIKDAQYMSFEEFVEAMLRLALVANIDKNTKKAKVPKTMATSPSKSAKKHKSSCLCGYWSWKSYSPVGD